VQSLKEHDFKPMRTKAWEPLATYERRLVQIASTDTAVTAASRKQVDEPVDHEEHESENGTPMPRAVLAGPSRPRPKPRLAKGLSTDKEPDMAASGTASSRGTKRSVDEVVLEDEQDEQDEELVQAAVSLDPEFGGDVEMEEDDGAHSDGEDRAVRSQSYSRLRSTKRPKRG
jgi:hypothetical protein